MSPTPLLPPTPEHESIMGSPSTLKPHGLLHRAVVRGAPLLFILLVAPPLSAATYYVRTDGNDGNDGLADSPSGAWQTIDHAADHASAGDVIRVQAGTYEERVTPAANGEPGNTITFVADGAVTMCGWDLSDNSHLRVAGFTIDTGVGSCSMNNGCVVISGTANDYLEFWNNTFTNATYNGIRIGIDDRYNHSVVMGNTLHGFGINNGSGVAIATRGNNNLIAYNEVYDSAPDGFVMFGANNRWVGNYIHGLNEDHGGHADGFQTGSGAEGWQHNLFESNTQIGMGNLGDEHVAQISNAQAQNCGGPCGDMTENIFRRNVWHNISQGTVGINQTDDGAITFTRYYNNTNAESAENSNARYSIAWYGTLTSDSFIHNNIESEGWGDGVSSNLEVFYVTGGLTCDYNLAHDPQGPVTFAAPFSTQAHGQPNGEPDFDDYDNDDFHIGADSEAIDHAGPLTFTSGSGTGTTFDVVTGGGGFFRGDDTGLDQYGGELVVGDTITVGDDVVVVSSVSGDAITVLESFDWEDGEGVTFGDDATPDIGAYPYKSGGYGYTATYSEASGVVTVTPSDPSLVRMVVVFDDGIPVGADSTSPYSVAGVGDGTLDVRVYPRYASTTLYVAATLAGAGGAGGAGGGEPGGGGGTDTGGSGTGPGPLPGDGGEDDGCGCRQAGSDRWRASPSNSGALALLGVMALGLRRHRRARRGPGRRHRRTT